MTSSSILQNKTFLFTGTLTEYTRDEAESLVEANGGKVLSGVSAKLNYLVVGEDAGSKLDKAKKLGTVMIISENDFLKMISNGTSSANSFSNSETQVPSPSEIIPKIESSIGIEKSQKKSISQKNTTENTEITPKNLPDNDVFTLSNSTKVNRKELSSIKKLLTSDSYELIDTGLLMLSGLDDPILVDTLLEGINFLNFELIPNDLFMGSKKKQPILNYSLLGVLSLVNDKCTNSFPLKSKISELHIDLSNLKTLSLIKGLKRIVLSDSLYKLKNLDGLENLEILSGLILKDCPNLKSIESLKNLPICEFDWGPSKLIESLAPLKNKVDSKNTKHLLLSELYELDSLEGIEFYQNVETIQLEYCHDLTDVSYLRKLPFLREVQENIDYKGWNTFDLNKLKSVDGLLFQKQHSLKVNFHRWENVRNELFADYKYLSFECNSMSNLDWLSNFPNLLGLEIISSDLTDISGLVACQNLIALIIHSPVLEDMSVISQLTNLEALNINSCKAVKSIDFVSELKSLKWFGDTFSDVMHFSSYGYSQMINTLDIDNLTSLNSLDALFSLDFFQNQIEKMICFKTNLLHGSGISKFKKLKSMRIAECAVTDELLSELIQIDQFVELRLVNCSIIDFKNKTKSNLYLMIDSSRNISIKNCKFNKIQLTHTAPKGFEKIELEMLEIVSSNSLTNLAGINQIDTKSLEISGLGMLDNADEIQQMKNLEQLSLRKLPVLSKIGFLAAMSNLDGLYTEECPLLEVKPKPKGLMTKNDLINYQLKIAVQLKLPIAKSIAEMLNQTKEAKSISVSLKEIRNVKKLLQTRDLSIIMSGIDIVASLQDEALCSELLEGIKFDGRTIEPNKTFKGTGPAQPYLNTAMMGILNVASQFKAWADFISSVTEIHMNLMILDYIACLKNVKVIQVYCVSKSSVKLTLPELRSFTWKDMGGWQDLPYMTDSLDLSIFEDCRKLENFTLHTSLNFAGGIECFSNHTELKELHLLSIQKNQIASLKPLANCKSLDVLVLNFKELGRITSLDGLDNIECIRSISIYNSAISDTSALKGLKNVEKLEITSPELEHFTPCEDFSKLTNLIFYSSRLSCSKLSTFDKGRYPEKMNEINLSNTAIKQLPEFTNLKSIDRLNLAITPVSDLTYIKTIKKIGQLNLVGCKEIVDFKDFEGVEEVGSLKVTNCHKLISFKGMKGIKLKDTTMSIYCMALQSLEDLRPDKWECIVLGMEKLPKISPEFACEILELPLVTSLEGIGAYQNVKELRFRTGHNYYPESALLDYSPLAEIPNLKKLVICTDKPLSLGHLAHFKHLEELNLVGCTQLSEPEKLANSHIDKLYIASCNLKKVDFPNNLQIKIDWQTKPWF